MANTPNFGQTFPVTIPVLTDPADITKAFKIYHNGSETDATVFDDSVAGHLAKKAPIDSPAFTGTVDLSSATLTLPSQSVTSTTIANNTIVDGDISTTAAISQSKISGLTTSLAAKAPLASPTFSGTVDMSGATLTLADNAIAQSKVNGLVSALASIRTVVDYAIVSASTYTVSLTDAGKTIGITNASSTVLTIPTNTSVAFAIGTKIDFIQLGSGMITFIPASGVTMGSENSMTKLNAQYSAASLLKVDTNAWALVGNLRA
jgi:hypothetical protein